MFHIFRFVLDLVMIHHTGSRATKFALGTEQKLGNSSEASMCEREFLAAKQDMMHHILGK